jgi:thymidylate synthase
MHLTYRNPSWAFHCLIQAVHDGTIPTERRQSRNGMTITIPEPVIITLTKPRERVLVNAARDCNPFFHLFESIWMLAGWNDIRPLLYFLPKYADFSDDGVTANGAYGYRWRRGLGRPLGETNGGNTAFAGFHPTDQLSAIIEHLKAKPESRRAVLQMWNVEDDLLKVDKSKDVCCNLSVMFSLREVQCGISMVGPHPTANRLDMTVVNRSNDLVWGLCGANMVHFSMLQEYIACALNVAVGHYHTMTNNLHIYTEGNSGFHPEKWLAEDVPRTPPHTSIPLFRENMREAFDRDCVRMMRWNDPLFNPEELETIFMRDVVHPMCMAFACHKVREYGPAFAALRPMDELARDWQLDAERWLRKRQADFKAKQEAADAAQLP